MKNSIEELAHNVLSRKHMGLDYAMEITLGEYTEKNASTYQAVYDEVQNILYPHGCGEDSTCTE